MKQSLPWESVPPPIYPAQSSLKPRKKWVQTGGWILVVVLLLFGGTKIPELMKGLGKGPQQKSAARLRLARVLSAVSADADDQKGRRSHEPRT